MRKVINLNQFLIFILSLLILFLFQNCQKAQYDYPEFVDEANEASHQNIEQNETDNVLTEITTEELQDQILILSDQLVSGNTILTELDEDFDESFNETTQISGELDGVNEELDLSILDDIELQSLSEVQSSPCAEMPHYSLSTQEKVIYFEKANSKQMKFDTLFENDQSDSFLPYAIFSFSMDKYLTESNFEVKDYLDPLKQLMSTFLDTENQSESSLFFVMNINISNNNEEQSTSLFLQSNEAVVWNIEGNTDYLDRIVIFGNHCQNIVKKPRNSRLSFFINQNLESKNQKDLIESVFFNTSKTAAERLKILKDLTKYFIKSNDDLSAYSSVYSSEGIKVDPLTF